MPLQLSSNVPHYTSLIRKLTLAIKKMGYSGREIGRFLNMRSYSAIRRAQEGKKVIDNSDFLWDLAEE